jgi:hypothetical protein
VQSWPDQILPELTRPLSINALYDTMSFKAKDLHFGTPGFHSEDVSAIDNM